MECPHFIHPVGVVTYYEVKYTEHQRFEEKINFVEIFDLARMVAII